jgi:hypothetical protein
MGRGALRTYRWGHTTAEPDRNTDLAARITARFTCASGHEFTVQFSAEADVPATWNCRQHGVEDCRRIDTSATTPIPEARRSKPARTPLVLLHERRSETELEALLADTLTAIRRLGGARPGCVIIGSRPYSYRYDS